MAMPPTASATNSTLTSVGVFVSFSILAIAAVTWLNAIARYLRLLRRKRLADLPPEVEFPFFGLYTPQIVFSEIASGFGITSLLYQPQTDPEAEAARRRALRYRFLLPAALLVAIIVCFLFVAAAASLPR